MRGSLGLADWQLSSRFSDRPYLKGIKWRVIEKDTQYPPVISTYLHTTAHADTKINNQINLKVTHGRVCLNPSTGLIWSPGFDE